MQKASAFASVSLTRPSQQLWPTRGVISSTAQDQEEVKALQRSVTMPTLFASIAAHLQQIELSQSASRVDDIALTSHAIITVARFRPHRRWRV